MGKDNINILSGLITKGLLAMIIPTMAMGVLGSFFNTSDMTVLKFFSNKRAVSPIRCAPSVITLLTVFFVTVDKHKKNASANLA